jgi:two-component system invasion response regulator UvrY
MPLGLTLTWGADAVMPTLSRKKIKILVVDDHALVRYAIRRLLLGDPDVEFVAEAENVTQALKCVREDALDVVTMDIRFPDQNGLDGLLRIKRAKPQLLVLMVTMCPEEQYAMRAIKGGASGYLHKSDSPDQLITAIHRIVEGGAYVSDAITMQLAAQLRSKSKGTHHELFSDREFAVLCAIAEGKSLTQIAGDSNLSAKTVTTYRKRVLDKLGMHSNTELVRYALEHGLVT